MPLATTLLRCQVLLPDTQQLPPCSAASDDISVGRENGKMYTHASGTPWRDFQHTVQLLLGPVHKRLHRSHVQGTMAGSTPPNVGTMVVG